MTFSLFRAFDAFQLTPSRRATMTSSSFSELFCISTHALTEGDKTLWTFQRISASFQLTPSRRATKEIFADAVSASISTHALTEGDYPLPAIRSHQHHFNSRPHGGRRGFRHHFAALHSHFNSRPHGGRH